MAIQKHLTAGLSHLGNSPASEKLHAVARQSVYEDRLGLSSTALAPRTTQFPTRQFFGVDISVCRRNEAIEWLLGRMARREVTKIAFANTHLLSSLSELSTGARLFDDFVVFNDGVGLDLGSIVLYGSAFPENLNGTDFVPALLSAAGKGHRVFFYGSRLEIVRRAAEAVSNQYGVSISGVCDGFDPSPGGVIAARIRATKPDIVLVALGNPKQEQWIADHGANLAAPLVIGVGAYFDILTGAYPRAPRWIRRARLEWLYRFALEPRRMWRRYTVEAFTFFLGLLR